MQSKSFRDCLARYSSHELLHPATPAPVQQFIDARPDWLHITQAPAKHKVGLEHLDAGEVEAILFAEHIGANLLMDDRAGVMAAKDRRLRTIGTIGVLDAAARRGMIDLGTALDNLGKTTFRMPKRIRQQLLGTL